MQIGSGITFTSGLSVTGSDAPSVTPTVEYLVVAGGGGGSSYGGGGAGGSGIVIIRYAMA